MKRRRTHARQGGFSLNEALISMTILSSGLLGLAQFQGEMLQVGGETRTRTSALALAREKLEELREHAKADFESLASGHDSPSYELGDQTLFSRSWTVESHRNPTYKEIQVSTAWTSIQGERDSVRLISLLSANVPYSTQTGK